MVVFLSVVAVIAGMLIAVPLSLWATKGTRHGKRSAGFVVASVLLLSFPFIGQRGPELIDESKDETNRKKDAKSGEPPTTGAPGD